MNIYIDLDDTLIVSARGNKDNLANHAHFFETDGWMHSICRPLTFPLLEHCREIAQNVRLITTSSELWAHTWNQIFNLGFSYGDIIHRDIFTHDMSLPYSSNLNRQWNGVTINDNNSVIIDNYSSGLPSPIQKMNYVFGKQNNARWIKIEEFIDNYNDHLEFKRIRSIINKFINDHERDI